ncbi:MAG: hypothetical protein COW02_11710 [Comamonadaceae bacterium CG12_big_fil_rev_8_21_14_0_65_59_15]|nr:MAG: hypothetical protein COW02_11710 [Comamonadaceae bacterium CG12_big_fil_rev_8_21_14_0_65_59_15]
MRFIFVGMFILLGLRSIVHLASDVDIQSHWLIDVELVGTTAFVADMRRDSGTLQMPKAKSVGQNFALTFPV